MNSKVLYSPSLVPEGWNVVWNSNSQHYYYVNLMTGQTQLKPSINGGSVTSEAGGMLLLGSMPNQSQQPQSQVEISSAGASMQMPESNDYTRSSDPGQSVLHQSSEKQSLPTRSCMTQPVPQQ
ncbi:hypothetical protein BDC45DRAFT_572277 [Circinella umbellata]|nr:hypothetical protein BDC45DRAFT_572277 [Circinella umbellata]